MTDHRARGIKRSALQAGFSILWLVTLRDDHGLGLGRRRASGNALFAALPSPGMVSALCFAGAAAG
jgi:hypothetical protein